MDTREFLKKYGKFLALILSILVVMGSFFAGWILTVSSPLFVFLIFKFLGVWRNKTRVIYGVPAIAIGAILFFLAFSYQIANVEVQEFDSYHGNFHVVVKPYSTTDFSRNTSIVITYNNETNQSLYYEITSTYTQKAYAKGYLNGTVMDNKTVYRLNMTFKQGIYYIILKMDNTTDYGGEIIRDYPNNLFGYFVYYSGLWVILWLSMLYILLIFGVHMIRKSMELRSLRYE